MRGRVEKAAYRVVAGLTRKYSRPNIKEFSNSVCALDGEKNRPLLGKKRI